MIVQFSHPFSALLAGPSMSGKTHWVASLIKYHQTMIQPPPKKIYMCYSEYQPLYDTMSGVEFHKGMLDIDSLDVSIPKLVIFDDMMDKCNQKISDVFTKHAHHRNLSIIFVTQNLYQQSPHMRNVNLNSSYIVIFRNRRDINQLAHLSRSMYGYKSSNFLVSAFQQATESSSHGYLVIDLKPDSEDILRVRTGIFPSEATYIFVPSDYQSSSMNTASISSVESYDY